MAFIVVYDSCALYPNTQRDLLVRLALRRKYDIPDEKLAERRRRMNAAVRDCLVTNYVPLVEGLTLPDPDDRHVLAAAIKAGAQVIVTNNRKDFPADCLADWGIEPKSPDDFVMDLIDMDSRIVYSCVREIADSRRRPPVTLDEVLLQLEQSGLIESANALRLGPS